MASEGEIVVLMLVAMMVQNTGRAIRYGFICSMCHVWLLTTANGIHKILNYSRKRDRDRERDCVYVFNFNRARITIVPVAVDKKEMSWYDRNGAKANMEIVIGVQNVNVICFFFYFYLFVMGILVRVRYLCR